MSTYYRENRCTGFRPHSSRTQASTLRWRIDTKKIDSEVKNWYFEVKYWLSTSCDFWVWYIATRWLHFDELKSHQGSIYKRWPLSCPISSSQWSQLISWFKNIFHRGRRQVQWAVLSRRRRRGATAATTTLQLRENSLPATITAETTAATTTQLREQNILPATETFSTLMRSKGVQGGIPLKVSTYENKI